MQVSYSSDLPHSTQTTPDNSKKNSSTTSSLQRQLRLVTLGARHRALTQTIDNARGLTSTRLGVRKLIFKTCDFVDISNAMIPTALGGSTTTSPPIVIVILRQQLDYVIVDYKSSVFICQEIDFYLPFAAPDTRGLRHEKSSCILLTSKICESPSSWRSLSNT
jgi:hypothetical protein